MSRAGNVKLLKCLWVSDSSLSVWCKKSLHESRAMGPAIMMLNCKFIMSCDKRRHMHIKRQEKIENKLEGLRAYSLLFNTVFSSKSFRKMEYSFPCCYVLLNIRSAGPSCDVICDMMQSQIVATFEREMHVSSPQNTNAKKISLEIHSSSGEMRYWWLQKHLF